MKIILKSCSGLLGYYFDVCYVFYEYYIVLLIVITKKY